MKKTFLLIIVILSFGLIQKSIGQTMKQLRQFPEEYVGKIITFSDIRFWPILHEVSNYYTVELNIATYPDEEWGFSNGTKIVCVVGKEIAKKMINEDIGGYNTNYYGAVTGTVIKSDKIFLAKYIFELKKVKIYPPGSAQFILFEKTK